MLCDEVLIELLCVLVDAPVFAVDHNSYKIHSWGGEIL